MNQILIDEAKKKLKPDYLELVKKQKTEQMT